MATTATKMTSRRPTRLLATMVTLRQVTVPTRRMPNHNRLSPRTTAPVALALAHPFQSRQPTPAARPCPCSARCPAPSTPPSSCSSTH
jgi:hypothetical protein